MTEILVASLEDEDTLVQPLHRQSSASIQMQGFAADESAASPNSFVFKDQRDRTSSRASQYTSVHSEPDLDTIMPLPGHMKAHGGYHSLPGEGSDSDGEGSSPTIASFTTVEVCMCYCSFAAGRPGLCIH